MKKPRTLPSLVAGWAIAASLGSIANAAELAESVRFDIAPQSLETALLEFSRQAGIQVFGPAQGVSGKRTTGIHGELIVEDALKALLKDSGLTYRPINKQTVAVGPEGKISTTGAPLDPSMRLAQADQPANPNASSADATSDRNPESSSGGGLQEIIVTAARRTQRAQDFAGGLQVFNGGELDRRGVNGFNDYLPSVPGASFRDQGNGSTSVSLRGISNVGGSDFGALSTVSTVGVYLNEVPIQGTSMLPDLALYDLSRVEVLKGPQGTLYGEGAMGGAIRMMLNAPDPAGYRSTADATLASTDNGGINYRVRGMMNAPLGESTALRVVGSYRDDDGFIDNLATGKDDINGRSAWSVRALLSSQLTERFSIDVLALHDASSVDGFPQMDRRVGDVKVNNPETEYADVDTSIFGLTLQYDLGGVDLTSVTSYYDSQQKKQAYAPYPLAAYFPSNVAPSMSRGDTDLGSFAQELRLVRQGDNRLDWVAGVFYRDKTQDNISEAVFTDANFAAANALLAAAGDPLLTTLIPGREVIKDTYEQVAVYGEITYEVVDRLDLTLGARWFDEDVESTYDFIGSDVLAPISLSGLDLRGKDSGVIPKIGLAYKLDRSKLLYALASQGFRSSGPNVIHSFFPTLGEDFVSSDSLWNYEIGTKTTWLDGHLQANVDAFYVDWRDIQGNQIEFVSSIGADLGFVGNAGNAEIRGAELEINAFFAAWEAGLAVGLTDSELTQSNSNTLVGAQLPNVPKWTGSTYLQYRFPVARGEGTVRFDARYVDSQVTRFIAPGDDGSPLDSYSVGNLRFGFTPESGAWGLDVFVDNLWDERAELGRDLAYAGNTAFTGRFTVNQPRTVGVTFRVSL